MKKKTFYDDSILFSRIISEPESESESESDLRTGIFRIRNSDFVVIASGSLNLVRLVSLFDSSRTHILFDRFLIFFLNQNLKI